MNLRQDIFKAIAEARAARQDAVIRRAIIRAFNTNKDAKSVVLWAPGMYWRSDWGIANFPAQERIYL